MRVILSEILSTEYQISIPFNALLGRVPVMVYAVLDRTVILQIIGEDHRRVVRHDIITVETNDRKLTARPTPLIDKLHKSRTKGRENSHKHEENGEAANIFEIPTDSEIEEFHKANGSKFDPLERLAEGATHISGQSR